MDHTSSHTREALDSWRFPGFMQKWLSRAGAGRREIGRPSSANPATLLNQIQSLHILTIETAGQPIRISHRSAKPFMNCSSLLLVLLAMELCF